MEFTVKQACQSLNANKTRMMLLLCIACMLAVHLHTTNVTIRPASAPHDNDVAGQRQPGATLAALGSCCHCCCFIRGGAAGSHRLPEKHHCDGAQLSSESMIPDGIPPLHWGLPRAAVDCAHCVQISDFKAQLLTEAFLCAIVQQMSRLDSIEWQA